MLHITAGEFIHVFNLTHLANLEKNCFQLTLPDFFGSLAVFCGFQTAPLWISGDQRQKTCYKNMTC